MVNIEGGIRGRIQETIVESFCIKPLEYSCYFFFFIISTIPSGRPRPMPGEIPRKIPGDIRGENSGRIIGDILKNPKRSSG